MPRKSKDGLPGSIYVKNKCLVIKIFGKIYTTGLRDTKENRKYCELKKKQIYLKSFLEQDEPVASTIYDLFKLYINRKENNRMKKTLKSDKLAFRKIVQTNYFISIDNLKMSINDFLDSNKNLTSNSINTYLRTFQVFVNWLFENKYIKEKVNFLKENRKKSTKKDIRIFEDDELDKLFESSKIVSEEFHLLLKFLLKSGARISEALNLTYDLVLNDRIIFENKNTRKLEYIPLSIDLKNILEIQKEKKYNGKKVFRWTVESHSFLLKYLKKTFKLAGIEYDGRGFHTFRRTFLFHLYRKGVPLQDASKLMRHNSVNLTYAIYSYFDISNLQEQLNKI